MDADPVKVAERIGPQLRSIRTAAENLRDLVHYRVSIENRVKRGGHYRDVAGREGMDRVQFAVDEEKRAQEDLITAYELTVPGPMRDELGSIYGFGSGHSLAALIGFIGHPRLAIPLRWEDRPKGGWPDGGTEAKRNVSDGDPFWRPGPRTLFAYCGIGDPLRDPKLIRNCSQEQMLAGGRKTVVQPRLRVWSDYIAKSVNMGKPNVLSSEWGRTYQKWLADGRTRSHTTECVNKFHKIANPSGRRGCGTTAHPEWGDVGSPWRPNHAVYHAHRKLQQSFLLRLWDLSEDWF